MVTRESSLSRILLVPGESVKAFSAVKSSRSLTALVMTKKASRTTNMTATPAVEYRIVSRFFCFMACSLNSLSRAMAANDDAGGKQREPDDRQEENNVPRIQHSPGEPFKIRNYT